MKKYFTVLLMCLVPEIVLAKTSVCKIEPMNIYNKILKNQWEKGAGINPQEQEPLVRMLMADPKPVATESLARLSQIALGEATSERINEAVTARGKKILSLLKVNRCKESIATFCDVEPANKKDCLELLHCTDDDQRGPLLRRLISQGKKFKSSKSPMKKISSREKCKVIKAMATPQ